ncbi:MAG: branched-chain amino acid ABC transporter permease [Desulfobacterales bacterium]|jgi:branched-chain amino acid transport system permease protein
MIQRQWIMLLIVIVSAALIPAFFGVYWISLILQILIYGLLALSVDLLIGHTGLVPLGHAAFFATAAYTTAILQVRHDLPSIIAGPAGILAAVALALIFALSVRTKGVYFMLVTLAMGHIIWGLATTWVTFTGGDNGITNVPLPTLGPFAVSSLKEFYYVVVVVVAVCLIGYRILIQSPFGLTLRGIRESDSRMDSLGYHVAAHKYAAFVMSGFLAGIAGVLYIYFNRFISPDAAWLHVSFDAMFMTIVGGSGTIVGPFIGSIIVHILKNVVGTYTGQWLLIMGLVFIATVMWAPYGIIGLIGQLGKSDKNSAKSEMDVKVDPVEGE